MADRTGIVSFANLPLLWLFAGRNNICAWATGWNFATFNIFHRHVAWIATIQAVAHTVLYLILFFQSSSPLDDANQLLTVILDSDPWRKLQKPYLIWGTLVRAANPSNELNSNWIPGNCFDGAHPTGCSELVPPPSV